MILPEERKILEELQAHVRCAKRFACVESALEDLCAGKYHANLNILECLEKTEPACEFARPFGDKLVCTCEVRKFIAKNFDRWSAPDTDVLRVGQAAPQA